MQVGALVRATALPIPTLNCNLNAHQLPAEYHYDVIVVGGGPAGSSAAYAAAKNGASVVLLEKESAIAESVRTSGVTWIQDIREFGIPDECFNPVKNFSFCSPNNEVTITDAVPRAAVLDVRGTYRWLAEEARKAGAEIMVKTNVTGIIRNKSGDIAGVSGTGPDGEVTFHGKVIIDASGFSSVVCRAMNLAPKWKRFGAGAEYEARVENADPDTWWLMVGQKYSPAGYAWIFPVGGDIVRIGVGVGKPESDIDPTQRLKDLIRDKTGPIKKLGRITPIEFHYGMIPNDGLVRRTVFNNLIMVGDSAGQANPLVLEGIRYAIRYGRTAGKVASDATRTGRTDRDSMYRYEEEWRSGIESKINSAGGIQNRWIGFSDREWDEELNVINELKPDEFLDFIRAEFGLSYIIRLTRNHPRLAVRQLFGMVRRRAARR